MTQKQLHVFSNAVEGQDDALNHWYDTQHLGDVLKVPGVAAARRFSANGGQSRYLAVYELDTDDAEGVMTELGRRAGGETMPMSDAMDVSSVNLVVFTAIGERRTA